MGRWAFAYFTDANSRPIRIRAQKVPLLPISLHCASLHTVSKSNPLAVLPRRTNQHVRRILDHKGAISRQRFRSGEVGSMTAIGAVIKGPLRVNTASPCWTLLSLLRRLRSVDR